MFKKAKWVLFVPFFIAVFLLAVYVTFPALIFKDFASSVIESYVKSKTGLNSEVKIADVSTWRLSGLDLKNVTVQLIGADGNPGSKLPFEHVKIRRNILSLFGAPSIGFAVDEQGDTLTGAASMMDEKQVASFSVSTQNFNLKKLAVLESLLGLPLHGDVKFDLACDFASKEGQNNEGRLSVEFKKLAVGPGRLKLPIEGFVEGVTIPVVNLGDFSEDLELVKGKVNQIRLSGGDLETDVSLTVDLNKDLMRSKIEGSGWFKVADAFLKKNPKFKTLLDLSPDLKAARESDGKYPFSFRGTLDRPNTKLGRLKALSEKDQKYPLRSLRSQG